MAAAGFLGLDGKPMRRPSAAALQVAVARPSLTGVRQVWNATPIAAGLTPQRLATIMRMAAEGTHAEYVILAEEMEERDWHYSACLSQRKLAVLELERVVKPASDSPDDVAIADAVRSAIIEDEAFEDLLTGLLDALGKGWSAVEMAWDTTSSPWKPASYEWRDPRWFLWDRETGRELRMLDEADLAFGVELPPDRFSVHRPQLKMGLPVRGGLARLAAWAFLFKFYSVKDWAAYCETYGQPLRVGKYDAAATQEDIEVLYQAVAMIGTDCAAVIPQAMQIEFVNAQQGASTSGASLYQSFGTWLDTQVSKAVLGQTGTTDMQKGGGFAQSKVLDGLREDLRDSDAKQLARTIRRDVFEPFVRWNYGPTAVVPGFRLQVEESADLEMLAGALAPLIDRGLRIRANDIRAKFNLDEPGADDEVLTPDKSGASRGAAPSAEGRALNRRRWGLQHGAGCACPSCGTRATNRDVQTDHDAIDALVDPLAEGWRPVMEPLVEPIVALADRAQSFEEFAAGLADAAADMDPAAFAEAMAKALFQARGLGDATDDPGS